MAMIHYKFRVKGIEVLLFFMCTTCNPVHLVVCFGLGEVETLTVLILLANVERYFFFSFFIPPCQSHYSELLSCCMTI